VGVLAVPKFLMELERPESGCGRVGCTEIINMHFKWFRNHGLIYRLFETKETGNLMSLSLCFYVVACNVITHFVLELSGFRSYPGW
jgi:hypothetical protein